MPNKTFQTELHTLSEVIKSLREIFKLSQTKLARLTGVSRSVIADIEQERRFPNSLTLLKLCTVFEITPAELSADAFPNWQITVNKAERTLLHKALRNTMNKTVIDAAIGELRKEK